MRNVLVLLPALALAAPDIFAGFEPPVLLEQPAAIDNDTLSDGSVLELLKRQNNGCATGYAVCTKINQPGLCCPSDSSCSADSAGHPACCPSGSACTGTISPVGTTSISISTTSGSGGASTTASSTGSFVLASTTGTATSSGGPFIQQTSAARSTVSNKYYPFPYIPTTYTNAAACSSAYTSCQSDAASCTAALASGQQGVTVSAPNGGATVTAIASLGTSSASSICSSLSQEACSGLIVEACASFGSGQVVAGAATMCAGLYGVVGGVAVGIAGQILR